MTSEELKSASMFGKEVERNPHSFYMRWKKNQRHNVALQNRVYYLKEGSVSLYKIKDNVLIMGINSPAVLGLSFFNKFNPNYYFRCTSESEFHVLDLHHALVMMDEKNLWKYAFYNVCELVQHYMIRDSLAFQKNTHSLVVDHLRVIWSMEENERKKTSIYTYILDRNIISRSAIHKVVAELQSHNVIKVFRGKLIEFNDRRQN